MDSFLTEKQSVEENKFWIGYASPFESRCNSCSKQAASLEIIIISQRKLFHLNCFPYETDTLLQISDFDIHLNNSDIQILENYILIRNASQLPLKCPLNHNSESKRKLSSKYFLLKRAWIEILKFSHPTDEVLKFATISKAIYDATNSEELWHHFCLVDFEITKSIKTSWIIKYRKAWKRTCFGCKTKKMKKSEIAWCKYIKKPLCLNCIKNNPDFKIIYASKVKEEYFVDPEILNFNFWRSDNGNRFTYHFKLYERICKWRQENKENLLKKFKDIKYFEDFKRLVDSLNLRKMTGQVRYPLRLKSNRFTPMVTNIFFYIRNQGETLNSIENCVELIEISK